MADNGAIEAQALRDSLYRPVFPKLWPEASLYELALWTNGMAFRNIDFTNIGHPVIKIAEIKNGISGQTKFTNAEYESCYFVTAGEMLFSWSGQPETSINVFWWRGQDGWLNQHIFKVKPVEYLDPVFFFYMLRYLKPNFVRIARNKQTTGLGHVTIADLKRMTVGVPPLPEQHAIAAILGALDDKIELNHRMNQTLEAIAQAIFKSWFVDFEPFRDQGMEESALGPIPRGWITGRLNNIASFVKGVSYRSDDLQESTVALVTLKSVARGGGYQQEGLKPYIGEYKPEQQLQPGEIIVAHTDLTQAAEVLGRAARVQAYPQFPTLVASLDLVIVRPVGQAASNEFLYSMLSRSDFQEHAYGYANGTTVLHLSAKALPEYQCVLPPPTIIEAFTRLARPVYKRIDYNEAQSYTLAAIRDALLPKLLSGEIRVKDAEKFVEGAV